MPAGASSAHFMLKLGYVRKDNAYMSLRVDSTNSPSRAFTVATAQNVRCALAALNYWQLHALPGVNGLVGTHCSERIQRARTLQADWIFRRSDSKQTSRIGAQAADSRV